MPGLYVACFLRPQDAAQLAVDGGEDPAALHVTLAYLGDNLPEDAAETARQTAGQIAFQTRPLAGVSHGFGIFRAADEEKDAFWACVDVPGLAELRDDLCCALTAAGLPPVETHGYSPHVTLAYLDAGRPVMIGPSDPVPLLLDTVSVCSEQMPDPARLPLFGVYVAKEQPSAGEVHVDAPIGGTPKKKRTRLTEAEAVPGMVVKSDDEAQVLGGIVLQPAVADSQGDVVTVADIEKAAHRFLYERTPIGLQHALLAPESVRPVESYLAPVDFEVDTPRGPELVRKGSWIVAAHIPDRELWEFAKANFTGWSIAGTGRRTPLG